MTKYAVRVCSAFGELRRDGAKPPFAAAATPAADERGREHDDDNGRSFRRNPSGIL